MVFHISVIHYLHIFSYYIISYPFRQVMEAIIQKLDEGEGSSFNNVTHGGIRLLKSAWAVFASMLPSAGEVRIATHSPLN